VSIRHSLLLLAVLVGWFTPAVPSKVETTSQVRPAERVTLVVSPKPQMRDVRRIGMNLGMWTSWGAEQLGSNIIKNPGFEGLMDGALSRIQSAHETTMVLYGMAVHRPDGFWNGASINIRTGISAGKSARIKECHRGIGGNDAMYAVLDSAIVAAPGDVAALSKVDDASAPSQWWLSEDQKHCLSGSPRPGSPGLRALVLCSTESKRAEANSYLDGITSRGGKMLPIRGKWRFSFWSRTLQGVPQLTVSFTRTGSRPFFARRVKPQAAWRRTVVDFDATDTSPDGPLQLQLSTLGNGRTAVDDVSLSRISDGTFPFRYEVVAALNALRPGYLRDWQGQLGDSISNRLAPPFGRRASRYRSDKLEDAKYEYSVPEFLQLCARVGASPWLVLPTTASDGEYQELGTYLARSQRRMHFPEILVEFGNENWNPLFGDAGIQDAKRHSEAAARAFLYVRKGAGQFVPLRTVVNAQFADAPAVAKLMQERVSDMVAVAPYFAYELPPIADDGRIGETLFATARETFHQLENTAKQNRVELAVYEVNLHTIGGRANAAERDRFVLSAEAGSALAMRLIDGLSSGLRRQCVYTLAGYDAYTADHIGFVQLWGVVRDLAGPPRLRATGLAVSMLNRTIQEAMHNVAPAATDQSGNLTAVAFKGNRGWSAAIVSGRTEPVEVTLSFAAMRGEALPVTAFTLTQNISNGSKRVSSAYRSPITLHDSTSTAVQVRVPPRSLVILLPGGPGSQPEIGASL
jgi:hypothetical protein